VRISMPSRFIISAIAAPTFIVSPPWLPAG
jgi:hypothetical protein